MAVFPGTGETCVGVVEGLTADRISASVRSYGRIPSMAFCALRSFAEATSFIAEVIFSVLRTDPILSLVSRSVATVSSL